ncbi:uncharacterized protein LOC62_06G008547 [Vanrija pseudolonga]|uniref:Uncharacterized protein n=1 Tax=Vanrija pseudolonga TaxID=143232 RepID=A0AAF0YK15_9TREE|nr:hypothetical protein LOC62_06G008547 [Vanrija pseudolonga]
MAPTKPDNSKAAHAKPDAHQTQTDAQKWAEQHGAAAKQPPCRLFAITQFECTATMKIECFPLERIFRQCGSGPAVEVTNHLTEQDGVAVVQPAFIAHPPKGKDFDFRLYK